VHGGGGGRVDAQPVGEPQRQRQQQRVRRRSGGGALEHLERGGAGGGAQPSLGGRGARTALFEHGVCVSGRLAEHYQRSNGRNTLVA